jgi:hypothetical protein
LEIILENLLGGSTDTAQVSTTKKVSALKAALDNEKGKERPTVYKGFYIYADQYVKLLEKSAYNKIHGIIPSSSSDMIRVALDEYLQD